ncbi:MAG: NTPase (NACHT family), partial [Oscillatoriales cyanobacterium C42_A2020_001]|nr:NTPase (NACHT family) [Leptolyngbyaceae cyanobacterium C42_A2020_001]
MLEWLITVGATELGKVMFEQVLKLGQSAAEDYVKDFFKGCLKEGIIATKPAVAKKAVAEALQAFLLLVEDELLDQGISEVEIRDRYEQPLLQFVQNSAVKPVLGKAFEKDCRAIAIETLVATWQASSFKKQPFPPMPEDFDWRRIGGEYVKKVRRIVRESTELRSLLETDLLEDIARNTAQLSP